MDWGKPYASQLLSVLRIVTALVLLGHGLQKLIGFPPPILFPQIPLLNIFGVTAKMGLLPVQYPALIVECVFGFLLLIGLWTRLSAFIISGEMAVAYWYWDFGHGKSIFPTNNGGDTPILLCFVCLYIFAAGAGIWSVDAGRETGKASAYA
jgi:putative oxidoreductase